MKLETTAYWLTIIGNLGLLIGVVLVLVQINQDSQLTRHQLSMERWGDDMNLQLVLMGENPAKAIAKAIEDPTQLTIEDAQVLEAYQLYWSLGILRRQFLFDRGMDEVPPPTFELDDSRTELALRVLGNSYMKATNQESKIGGPLLAPKLQMLMDSITGNETREHYERVIARIKEAQ